MIDFADLLSREWQTQERMGMNVDESETDSGRVASEVEVFRASSQAVAELRTAVSARQNHISLLLLRSYMISTFPALWQGSRDGVSAANFHDTLILEPNGHVFDGFTPVKWESRNSNCAKGDGSLKNCLFNTLIQ
jgi:hypothetical protein